MQEIINKTALIWTYGVWFVGAMALTAALYLTLADFFVRAISRHLDNLRRMYCKVWMYRAARHYNKVNPIDPRYEVTDPKEWLMDATDKLIALAKDNGYVVTITTSPAPFKPLEMGRYRMVPDIRESRMRYSNK